MKAFLIILPSMSFALFHTFMDITIAKVIMIMMTFHVNKPQFTNRCPNADQLTYQISVGMSIIF